MKIFFLQLLFIVTMVRPWPGFADTPGDIQVSISENSKGGHVLEGEFSISAPAAKVWEVLADYNGMGAFVSSIQSSREVQRGENRLTVEQVMKGQAGIFRKRVYLLLEVTEMPFTTILFTDTSKKSFKSYSGSWEIFESGNETKVTYKLDATPAFFAPDFLTVNAFKRNVKGLLKEVRAEISTRNRR